jgi:hypothetical protein
MFVLTPFVFQSISSVAALLSEWTQLHASPARDVAALVPSGARCAPASRAQRRIYLDERIRYGLLLVVLFGVKEDI